VPGFREQVATILQRTGLLAGVLRLRAALRLPVLTVLTYHHVDDPGADSPFDPGVADASPDQFQRQMETVAKYGTPVDIEQVYRIIVAGERPPPNPVLVTFDDGYRSCLEVAAPILRRVGVPATFFISTSFVQERRLFWWERISIMLTRARAAGRRGVTLPTLQISPSIEGEHARTVSSQPTPAELDVTSPEALNTLTALIKNTRGLQIEPFLIELASACGVAWDQAQERRLADQLIMTWDQVRSLAAAGMNIESHTRRHRVLQTVPSVELRDELEGARHELEAQLGRPVRAIAYPVGRRIASTPLLRDAVREAGYVLGFSNASGVIPLLPQPLRDLRPIDPLDLGRMAMGREFSDSMFLGQLALPPLAHPARHSHA
jgi:peptidoglycan/xylan/chitin deacetylase (PgdA/CDA1 family)